ncbi:uncharacterized protein MYCFIDRAFT_179912 [Pseudocercospora fijiensis CIRAD86]|uniref:Uncharacterized protein n=1 Tax=Pseudocercospora fijiensis (strain CIRAD86) TaxID=383855 RepID=M2ZYX5_PSEFD|nr:uncharacterized protein MYCFIDRAFT_179912 [Pseudocercospora fijiensis CIRAD86]EME77336.1 hypothetical protein MYCFIDRAFT_179912 [Pseudocercospora fijiensis CIRAD86]
MTFTTFDEFKPRRRRGLNEVKTWQRFAPPEAYDHTTGAIPRPLVVPSGACDQRTTTSGSRWRKYGRYAQNLLLLAAYLQYKLAFLPVIELLLSSYRRRIILRPSAPLYLILPSTHYSTIRTKTKNATKSRTKNATKNRTKNRTKTATKIRTKNGSRNAYVRTERMWIPKRGGHGGFRRSLRRPFPPALSDNVSKRTRIPKRGGHGGFGRSLRRPFPPALSDNVSKRTRIPKRDNVSKRTRIPKRWVRGVWEEPATTIPPYPERQRLQKNVDTKALATTIPPYPERQRLQKNVDTKALATTIPPYPERQRLQKNVDTKAVGMGWFGRSLRRPFPPALSDNVGKSMWMVNIASRREIAELSRLRTILAKHANKSDQDDNDGRGFRLPFNLLKRKAISKALVKRKSTRPALKRKAATKASVAPVKRQSTRPEQHAPKASSVAPVKRQPTRPAPAPAPKTIAAPVKRRKVHSTSAASKTSAALGSVAPVKRQSTRRAIASRLFQWRLLRLRLITLNIISLSLYDKIDAAIMASFHCLLTIRLTPRLGLSSLEEAAPESCNQDQCCTTAPAVYSPFTTFPGTPFLSLPSFSHHRTRIAAERDLRAFAVLQLRILAAIRRSWFVPQHLSKLLNVRNVVIEQGMENVHYAVTPKSEATEAVLEHTSIPPKYLSSGGGRCEKALVSNVGEDTSGKSSSYESLYCLKFEYGIHPKATPDYSTSSSMQIALSLSLFA